LVRPNKKSLAISMRQSWQLYLMLLLPLAYIAIFNYYPMLGAQIAFRNFSARLGMWGSDWVGLYHFRRFINSHMFWPVLRNTLILSSYAIIASIPVPIILALSLNAVRSRHYKKTVQLFTYMPHFISTVVMVGMLRQMLHPHIGLLAAINSTFGLSLGDPFGSASAFPHLLVWSRVWQRMGWASIIYFAALSSVDPSQHEAAIVDGASRFQRIRHIDFPIIIPAIMINFIMSMGMVMSIGFERVFLMQTDLNITSSEIIVTYVYRVGLTGIPDFSFATAINLFNSIINLFLIVVANFMAKKASGFGLF